MELKQSKAKEVIFPSQQNDSAGKCKSNDLGSGPRLTDERKEGTSLSGPLTSLCCGTTSMQQWWFKMFKRTISSLVQESIWLKIWGRSVSQGVSEDFLQSCVLNISAVPALLTWTAPVEQVTRNPGQVQALNLALLQYLSWIYMRWIFLRMKTSKNSQAHPISEKTAFREVLETIALKYSGALDVAIWSIQGGLVSTQELLWG